MNRFYRLFIVNPSKVAIRLPLKVYDGGSCRRLWRFTHKPFPDPEVIKCFSCSAEHERFSAYKYENANNSWHFHVY